MSVYSTPEQLANMRDILSNFVRMPFSQGNIPGSLVESVFAHVRGGSVLNTYDFVDVVHTASRCGWQVKSTKETTPVTWKRAKIENSAELIRKSYQSADDLQALGDTIINFCNEHARASMKKYDLNEIGYARLIIHKDRRVTYFERLLCSKDEPLVFNPRDFVWEWSEQKRTRTKEQLPALHGTNIRTEEKWWAWHGRGENQLHFSGESVWWPPDDSPNMFSFELPREEDRLSFERLNELLKGSRT